MFAPAQQAELHDSLSIAFLTLLEELTPLERAIFLLHEVFDYEYAEIAAALGQSEANCRQILRRAKQHVRAERPRFKASEEEHDALLERFRPEWVRVRVRKPEVRPAGLDVEFSAVTVNRP